MDLSDPEIVTPQPQETTTQARGLDSVVLMRHSDKKGQGLSEEGRAHALEVGKTELVEILETLPANALVFFIGNSDSPRTRETLELVAAGLHEALPDLVYVTPATLKQEAPDKGISARLSHVNSQITQNPDTRVVVAVPLALRGMNSAALLQKGGDTSYEDWLDEQPEFQTDGKPDFDKQFFQHYLPIGPQGEHSKAALDANELGAQVQESVDRLDRAAIRHLTEENALRPRVFVLFGHSWGIDAAIARTVSGGEIKRRGIDFLGEKLIGPAEAVQILYSDGKPHDVHYRHRATPVIL